MQTRLVTRAALVLLAAIPTSALATPIKFRLEFGTDAPQSGVGSELYGANLSVEYQWDAATLLPLTDRTVLGTNARVTTWPTTNTTAVLAITNSQGIDGVYSGSLLDGDDWSLTDIPNGADSIKYPYASFTV